MKTEIRMKMGCGEREREIARGWNTGEELGVSKEGSLRDTNRYIKPKSSIRGAVCRKAGCG